MVEEYPDTSFLHPVEASTSYAKADFPPSRLEQMRRLHNALVRPASLTTYESEGWVVESNNAQILGRPVIEHSTDSSGKLTGKDTAKILNALAFYVQKITAFRELIDESAEGNFDMPDDYWVESLPFDYKLAAKLFDEYKKLKSD